VRLKRWLNSFLHSLVMSRYMFGRGGLLLLERVSLSASLVVAKMDVGALRGVKGDEGAMAPCRDVLLLQSVMVEAPILVIGS